MFTTTDLWKIFNVIKGDTVTDITDVLRSLAQSEKAKTESLFSNTIDQFCFDTDDYRRLKGFLVNWYAALKTLTTVESKSSDPFSISDNQLDELFRSFGFNFSNNIFLNELTDNSIDNSKASLFLDLVNLYKIKGTPRSIVEILSYYSFINIDLYEYWLEKDSLDSLIFRAKPIISSILDPTDKLIKFDTIVLSDPHWMLTEEQILAMHSNNKINLPSKTPYFSIMPRYDLSEINQSLLIIARKIRDEYEEFQSTGLISEKNISILSSWGTVSLLELYLACIYSFNRIYSTGSNANLINCYDGTNVITTDIISEYNNLTNNLPVDRDDQKLKLTQYYDLFTRSKSGDFIQTSTSAGTLLNIINSDLYDYLDLEDNNYFIDNLLLDLGNWVRSKIDVTYINIAYVIGTTTLTQDKDIKNVINFFKPYRSRIIDLLEEIDINFPLLDSFRMKDSYSDSTIQTEYDFITAGGNLLDSTSVGFCCPIECPDSTSDDYCWGYRRDYYDCGSYHDIGCAWDEDYTYCYDTFYDSVSCIPDGTANIDFGYTIIDSTSGDDSTSISVIWVDCGFEDFDGDGLFDCVHGVDTCHIFVEDL